MQVLGGGSVSTTEGGEEGGGGGVVAEGFAEVGEAIDISGAEDEASAELEGIEAELVLTVAGGASAFAAFGIVAAKDVEQIAGAEVGDLVGLAAFVNQQRKLDSGFFLENAGVVFIAEADNGKGSAFFAELRFVFAQLRDVLAAENSTVVAKENDDCGILLPQRTEADFGTRSVWEDDVGELVAESLAHGGPSLLRKDSGVKGRNRVNSRRFRVDSRMPRGECRRVP